jgi:hypothetical protein
MPIGGVAVIKRDNDLYEKYYQAMVLEEKDVNITTD